MWTNLPGAFHEEDDAAPAGRGAVPGAAFAFTVEMTARALLIATMLTSAACAGRSAVRIGTSAPLTVLSGRWSGTYQVDGPADRLDGTLVLDMRASDEGAVGTVVLTGPDGQIFQPAPIGPATDAASAGDRPLAIRWFAASDGMMYGDIDLYEDPTRESAALTTLRAAPASDELVGTFRTTYADGTQASGTWSVTREDSQ